MHCNTEYLHRMSGDCADCESVNGIGVRYCEQKGFVLLSFVEFWILPLYSMFIVGLVCSREHYCITERALS